MIGRRAMLAGLAAAPTAAAVQPGVIAYAPTGRLFPVNGTRLWVDDSGPPDAPTTLYIHGGPGAGALDFETYMKPALAGRARLVSVDQRGVLRSDPIPDGTALTMAQMVDDLEALRRVLRIDRWQVVGHSVGGTIALRYALAHPDRVTRLTLENPAYDVGLGFRWLLAAAAQILIGIDVDAAVEAQRLADPATSLDAKFVAAMTTALGALRARREDLYVAQSRHRGMFSRLAAGSGLPEERWKQGARPGMALLHAADCFTPMVDRVAEIGAPILLVRGSGDHVVDPLQIAAVRKAGGRIEQVDGAGHFVHVEQPERFAQLLLS